MTVECFWQTGSPANRENSDSEDHSAPTLGRVLHIVNGEHYAGAERVQDLLGGALPWFGYETGIACLKPGRFPKARENQQVPLFECPMGSRFDLRPARTLVRLVRDHGYNLLHAHTPRALMVGSLASLLARVPLVYHIHSPAAADTTSRLRNWVNAFFERASLTAANHLIAVSGSLRERYLRLGFSPDRVTVVRNGVPCSPLLPMRERASGEPGVFGMVALFRPRKGLEVLLKAVTDLLASGRSLRLRAVGQFETPKYRQQIMNLVAELGVGDAIDWTGFSSHVEQELAQTDCFVLPSLFGEGLPMVVLEAMACGRPVIATDVEGTPEAIRHGMNGLLAVPNDAASLAETMKMVLDKTIDLAAMARQATEDQRARFSVCTMTRGIAEVYDRVLRVAGRRTEGNLFAMPCIANPLPQGATVVLGDGIVPAGSVTPTPELPV